MNNSKTVYSTNKELNKIIKAEKKVETINNKQCNEPVENNHHATRGYYSYFKKNKEYTYVSNSNTKKN